MHSGERWRLGHRPALTGLRSIAVTLVLITHIHVPGGHLMASIGVTMFFALSGFLITTLLLEEREGSGRISIGAFYMRRAARLAPALGLSVLLAVLVELAVERSIRDWSLIVGALTWTSNFAMMDGHFPTTPLSHTWSLAVEEQFYLLWPLILPLFARLPRRWAFVALGYLIVGGIGVRAAVFDPDAYLGHAYLGLDARADQLLIGAALALALVGSPPRRPSARWVAPVAVVIVALGIWQPARLLLPTIIAALTVAVLYVAAHTRVRWLEAGLMIWLGERAYGLYLYHRPIGYVVDAAIGGPWWLAGPITVAGTLAVAWASYRWVERPAIAWARRSGDPRYSADESEAADAVETAAQRRVEQADVSGGHGLLGRGTLAPTTAVD